MTEERTDKVGWWEEVGWQTVVRVTESYPAQRTNK